MLQTQLQAAGAEHLVIAHLLIRGVQAFRAQANQPGYDVLAVDPSQGASIRIQVKARTASDAGGWKVDSWDFDLLAAIRLNLGPRKTLDVHQPEALIDPQIYLVLPDDVPELRKRGRAKFRSSALPHGSRDDWPAVARAFARVSTRSNEGFSLDEFGRRRDDLLLSDGDLRSGIDG